MPVRLVRPALIALALAGAVLLAFAPAASACPFCDGGPDGVNEVRDGVFDEHFWPRAAATVAPFPVLAGIVALIYFGPPTFRRSGNRNAEGVGPAPPPSAA